MSDLVKRLRDPWPEVDCRDEAADRIEQLERELRDMEVKAGSFADSWTAAKTRFEKAETELAAEKALADSLHFALTNSEHADINAVFAAYRKARGL